MSPNAESTDSLAKQTQALVDPSYDLPFFSSVSFRSSASERPGQLRNNLTVNAKDTRSFLSRSFALNGGAALSL